MYSIFQPRQRVYFNRLFTHRTDHQDLQSINSKACYPYRHRTRCCECWVSHNYEDPCNSFREVRGAAEDYHQVHLSHPLHLDRHLATAEGGDLSLNHDHHSCQAVKVGECLQDLHHEMVVHNEDGSELVVGSEVVVLVEVEEGAVAVQFQ